MIFENNVTLVLMLCEFKVNGKEQCYRYLGKVGSNAEGGSPESKKSSGADFSTRASMIRPNQVQFKTADTLLQFTVEVVKQKTKFNQGLIIRKVKLTKKTF